MIVVRNENAIANENYGFNVVQSSRVPQNTQLLVLPEDMQYSDLNPSATDSICIVDTWTFLNNESIEMAKTYRDNYPYTDIRILLIKTQRRTLSTDISDVQAALNNAVYEYEQAGFPVALINENDVKKLFVWQKRAYSDMLRRSFKYKMQSAKRFMEHNYELQYELLKVLLKDNCLNSESLENFTRYDERVGFSKINGIADVASKNFFEESSVFIIELYDIYKAFAKGINLWDEKTIYGGLVNALTFRFKNDMTQILPVVGRKKKNDELSYHKFMLDTKFNAIFMQECNKFFNDTAKDVTKKYLDRVLEKMEELL